MTKQEIKAIQDAYEKIREANIPIKLISDKGYSDEDIRTIVLAMRKQLDWVNAHPDEEDPFDTKGKMWQDNYEILTNLAGMRGIEL